METKLGRSWTSGIRVHRQGGVLAGLKAVSLVRGCAKVWNWQPLDFFSRHLATEICESLHNFFNARRFPFPKVIVWISFWFW